MRKWRIEDSEELYNITGWGTSYFGINDKGHVVVTPRKDGVEVDLKELVDELQLRDVAAPMRRSDGQDRAGGPGDRADSVRGQIHRGGQRRGGRGAFLRKRKC